MTRVSGKVALVTGGARGLGAAHARALVREGAAVGIADVLVDQGTSLAEELGDAGEFLALDVTDADRWGQVVTDTERRFGPISVLINNAGVVLQEPIETLSESDYRQVVDINQVGVFLGMRAALPSLRRAGGGSIINVSSVGGIIGFPGILGYVASKWAVRGMTKAAAQELGPDGIRVNSVHPGGVGTEMTEGGSSIQEMVRYQPISRPGTPDEVASLVLFLASDESTYCTGTEFVVDGGYTCQ